MATPSSSLATLNPGLSSLFQYIYEEAEQDYITSRVLPTTPVNLSSDTFGVVPLKELAANSGDVTARAPGAGYSRNRMQFTSDSYSCEDHGSEEILDDNESRKYRNYLAAEEVATRRLAHRILTARERRTIAAVLDVTYYNADSDLKVTLSNKWDTASGTPVTDIEAAIVKVRDNTGIKPNALIINWKTYRALRTNPQVAAKISSSGAGSSEAARNVTIDMLRQVFDIDNIIVAGSMQNTANPNAAATMADLWGDHALVTRIATTADMQEPCIGRTFMWTGDNKTGMNDSMIDGYVETYREEAIRSEIIRARHNTDEKILYKDLACLLPSVRG